jgi:hypothetical protein
VKNYCENEHKYKHVGLTLTDRANESTFWLCNMLVSAPLAMCFQVAGHSTHQCLLSSDRHLLAGCSIVTMFQAAVGLTSVGPLNKMNLFIAALDGQVSPSVSEHAKELEHVLNEALYWKLGAIEMKIESYFANVFQSQSSS